VVLEGRNKNFTIAARSLTWADGLEHSQSLATFLRECFAFCSSAQFLGKCFLNPSSDIFSIIHARQLYF
jgi:hypothetical protein